MGIIANHIADREELNRLLAEYQNVMGDYHETLIRASKHHSYAAISLSSRTLSGEPFSLSEVQETAKDIQTIRTFWNGMVEADRTAKNSYSDAQAGIGQLLSNIHTFLDAIGKNGGKVGTLDVKQLRSEVFKDYELFDYLAEKLSNGEQLNDEERAILYRYIQEEIFGEGAGRDIHSIAKMMEENSKQLVERLNNTVLSSEASLATEIAMVELYLFSGNHKPGDHVVNGQDAANLSAYLAMLRNYQKQINAVGEDIDFERGPNDPLLARVEYIKYDVKDDPIKIFLDSELTISLFDEADNYTRENFMDVEHFAGGIYVAQPKVEYYYGNDAVNDLQRAENLKLEEQYANYRSDFIGKEAMKLLVSAVANKAKINPAVNVINIGVNYYRDESKLKDGITIGEAKLTAMDFDMELQLTTDKIIGKDEFEIQLRPTDSTFDILERWKEMKDMGAGIPYPKEEAIKHQDWKAIDKYFNENKSELKNEHKDIYYYIFDGDLEEGTTVEDLVGN
ncbi:hypothetical protein F3157_09165 [Virgibacillus dakarensis]|nr:hypothetical protein [Virgibacillus dakarensis]